MRVYTLEEVSRLSRDSNYRVYWSNKGYIVKNDLITFIGNNISVGLTEDYLDKIFIETV